MYDLKTLNFGVNCYLIKTNSYFILIDTGFSNKRKKLIEELEKAGCKYGNLKLIILTHGDSDHTDNAPYIRDQFGVKIAMHKDDVGIVENANMQYNRKEKSDYIAPIFKFFMFIFQFFLKNIKFEKFSPDILFEDGFDLSEYGFDAKIIHIPGHSKGSIGILTNDGNFFCGDLIYNAFGRQPSSVFIDNIEDYNNSIDKIKKLNIKTIYPGHGKEFLAEKFLKNKK